MLHSNADSHSDEASTIVNGRTFRRLIGRDEISRRVAQLGKLISQDYCDKQPLFVAVLKGSLMFAADLARSLTIPCELEFVRASSYGNSMTAGARIKLRDFRKNAFEGRDIILVEDIVDSGRTISSISQRLNGYSPNSIRIATFLFKPEVYRADLALDYVGFEIPVKFVVGYGMDFAEQGRGLPDVYALDR